MYSGELTAHSSRLVGVAALADKYAVIELREIAKRALKTVPKINKFNK